MNEENLCSICKYYGVLWCDFPCKECKYNRVYPSGHNISSRWEWYEKG